jgi:hypothetical protein
MQIVDPANILTKSIRNGGMYKMGFCFNISHASCINLLIILITKTKKSKILFYSEHIIMNRRINKLSDSFLGER